MPHIANGMIDRSRLLAKMNSYKDKKGVFFMLTEKPIHFDEGINGWFSMKMNQMGFYKYDPQNYHGPLYFYLLKKSAKYC